MHVDAPEPGQVEHSLWEDQTVGDHQHEVGRGRAQQLPIGLVAQPRGLSHGKTQFECALLDRRREKTLAASGGPVGLTQNKRHFVARLDHRIENGGSERRRSGENEPQHSLRDSGVRTLSGVALLLGEFGADAALLETRQVLHENPPVQVVDFMLQADG